MGSAFVEGLLGSGAFPPAAMQAHLESNLYPAVGAEFLPAALAAVDLVARSVVEEDEALRREEPDGLPVWYVDAGRPTTAVYLVEKLHLEVFVEHAVAGQYADACADGEGVLP